jgi:hypothetical protein
VQRAAEEQRRVARCEHGFSRTLQLRKSFPLFFITANTISDRKKKHNGKKLLLIGIYVLLAGKGFD